MPERDERRLLIAPAAGSPEAAPACLRGAGGAACHFPSLLVGGASASKELAGARHPSPGRRLRRGLRSEVRIDVKPRGTSLTAYLDAIFETECYEQTSDGRWRCTIPVLSGWSAEGEERYQSCRSVEDQVVAWVARRLLHDEPLPVFEDVRPEIVDVVLPDILTERLRLVPFTASLFAAATFDRAALATRLDVGIHSDWPYPEVLFEEDDDEEPGEESEEPSWPHVLHVSWMMRQPEAAPWKWMIVHARDRLLVGGIGTTNPLLEDDSEDDNIQIGYSLVPAYQNRGYMTEAARAYIAWVFAHPAVKWIYAMTQIENVRSRRVLEKLGAHPLARGSHTTVPTSGWVDWELLPEHFVRTKAASGPSTG
jgi:[ribosomal protein S5]-alanine N-acetyltransferase